MHLSFHDFHLAIDATPSVWTVADLRSHGSGPMIGVLVVIYPLCRVLGEYP